MNYTLLIHEPPELFAMRSDPAKRAALFEPIGAYLKALREAGVIIFEVAHHDEALFWARRCPALPGRVLELRPNLVPME